MRNVRKTLRIAARTNSGNIKRTQDPASLFVCVRISDPSCHCSGFGSGLHSAIPVLCKKISMLNHLPLLPIPFAQLSFGGLSATRPPTTGCGLPYYLLDKERPQPSSISSKPSNQARINSSLAPEKGGKIETPTRTRLIGTIILRKRDRKPICSGLRLGSNETYLCNN